MSVTVRAADLDADRPLVLAHLARHLPAAADPARYDWLYCQNPHGRARVWLATDSTRAVVGMLSAVPRRFFLRGEEVEGWILADCCMAEGYRSLGPALTLQRRCLQEAAARGIRFCCDFPSASMMAVYGRLGIPAFGWMIRLARPLGGRAAAAGGDPRRRPARARALALLGGRALDAVHGIVAARPGATPHDGRCGEEFTQLARRAARDTACVARSADYLNWRYIRHPLHRHRLLTVRRDGGLLGYAVICEEGDEGHLVDVCNAGVPAVDWALLRAVLRRFASRRVATAHASLWQHSGLATRLRRLGFWQRDRVPVVVFPPSGSALGNGLADPQAWHLAHGDRES
jgi:hypothetical protein